MSQVSIATNAAVLQGWLQRHPVAARAVALELIASHGITTATTVLRELLQRHPFAVRAAGFGLMALGGIVVGPAILVGILNLIGFGAAGVGAGTLAAAIQAAIGNVAAGSLFAWAQAAAAGGIAVAPAAIQLLGAGATALGAYLGLVRPRDSTPEPETEPDNTTAFVSREDAQAMLDDPAFARDMANGLAASLNLDRPSNDAGASSSRHPLISPVTISAPKRI
ncbi:hypothetical protein FB451DRAFT_1556522 [Mycena latifolia]|nr:hypothetical protein FB451DRAFT_1556522 [Mycena latifolia]